MVSVIAVTGHRPNGLPPGRAREHAPLTVFAAQCLAQHQPDVVIVGMALGWDLAVAQAALSLHIPYIAAVPYPGQERDWSLAARARYTSLLRQAAHVVTVSPAYSREAMHQRNRWMVDRAQLLLALAEGQPSGTEATIRYARSKGCAVVNYWGKYQAYLAA